MTYNDMIDYKVEIDLSQIFYLIKDFNIPGYRKKISIMKITAKNPDHASHLVYKNLARSIEDAEILADDKETLPREDIIETVSFGMKIKKIIPIKQKNNA